MIGEGVNHVKAGGWLEGFKREKKMDEGWE